MTDKKNSGLKKRQMLFNTLKQRLMAGNVSGGSSGSKPPPDHMSLS